MGPFVDNGDGHTPEPGLTIQKADVLISKAGASYAAVTADQGEADAGAPYDAVGDYSISLAIADTDAAGIIKIGINKSGALPVFARFMVVPGTVYDSLVGGDDFVATLDGEGVKVTAVGDTAVTDPDDFKADLSTVVDAADIWAHAERTLTSTGVDLTELTEDPGVTPSIEEAITLLYMWLRNNNTATAIARTIKNDAGTTILSATVSDDGTTFSQGKLS